MWIFECMGVLVPLTPALFKGLTILISTSKCLPMRPGLLETQRWREPEGGCPALTEPSFSGRDDKRQFQPDALNAMHRCEVRNTDALGKSEVKE